MFDSTINNRQYRPNQLNLINWHRKRLSRTIGSLNALGEKSRQCFGLAVDHLSWLCALIIVDQLGIYRNDGSRVVACLQHRLLADGGPRRPCARSP